MVTTEVLWPRLLNDTVTSWIGAGVMLVVLTLYISATVVFGLRFSNLTNRGVITSGPYRLMKHPAYFAHVVNAWVIVFVLLPAAGTPPSLGMAVVPVAFTVFYRARALTEERHMREEPAYREYEAWIAEHGLLARLMRPLRSISSRASAGAVPR